MEWATGLLLTNTPIARGQTQNNRSLLGKQGLAFNAPHIRESIPVFLNAWALRARVSSRDAYENSQSYWVSLSARTFSNFYARMAGGCWSGVAGLFPCLTCPSPHPLLGGIVHTAPSSHQPKKLLPYLYSLGTLCKPSDYSFVLQMFAMDLLDYVLFLFSPEWLYNFSISTLGDVSCSLKHYSQIHSSSKGRHWLCIHVLLSPLDATYFNLCSPCCRILKTYLWPFYFICFCYKLPQILSGTRRER